MPITPASTVDFWRLTSSTPTCCRVAASRRSARIRARPREISGCWVKRLRKSARVRVKTTVGLTVVTVADLGLPVSSDISPIDAPSPSSATRKSIPVTGSFLRTSATPDRITYIDTPGAVSYTHLRAHETPEHLVCRLLLEKKTPP